MTRYIQRHSLLTRVTHGVAAVACILLAVTGVFVFVPSLGGGIMGGEFTQTMRMLHRVLAVPFILVPLFAVLKSPAGFVHLFKEDIFGKWDKDDVTWAMKFPFYLFAPGKVHMPPQHHVKSAQRLADGALLFFCIMLALSGIVLWLNTGFPTGSGLKVDFPLKRCFLHTSCMTCSSSSPSLSASPTSISAPASSSRIAAPPASCSATAR